MKTLTQVTLIRPISLPGWFAQSDNIEASHVKSIELDGRHTVVITPRSGEPKYVPIENVASYVIKKV